VFNLKGTWDGRSDPVIGAKAKSLSFRKGPSPPYLKKTERYLRPLLLSISLYLQAWSTDSDNTQVIYNIYFPRREYHG